MKTLVIIDFQKDFADVNGSLRVDGSLGAEQAILDYINLNHEDIADVVFTVDWHSPKHCSFKKNGGIWPAHCVQYSEGAGVSDKLMNTCMDYNLPIKIFVKGNVDDVEEYGAFDFIDNSIKYLGTVVNNIARNCTLTFDTNNLVVCGIAGDYCVKSSIENLLKAPEFNISVLKDGIASIDDGTTLDNFIKENNLKVVE